MSQDEEMRLLTHCRTPATSYPLYVILIATDIARSVSLALSSLIFLYVSDMGSIPFCQFQFQSIPIGQFHIKFINPNSPIPFFNDSFYLLLFTNIRYSEYLLGIPTLSSL